MRDGASSASQLAARARLRDWLAGQTPSGALAAPLRVDLGAAERADLQRPASGWPDPLRIGVVKTLSPSVAVSGFAQPPSKRGRGVAHGILQATDDGGFVWAASISSEGAGGLRVQLSDVRLPPGAALYFYSPGGDAYGPYRDHGPNGDGDFWTDSIVGSEGVVLLRQFGPAPAEQLRQISFTITAVGHIAPGFPVALEDASTSFCGNPDCIIDVSCLSSPAVADATNAVAQLEWVAGAYLYTCSGGLLADTDTSTQIPYLLTANHCLRRAKDAKNLEAFFLYRTSSCGETCPSNTGFPKTLGATIKATGSVGDFTLLQLKQTPPAGTVMLGWNADPVAFIDGIDLYRISHPNFGAQVYSHHRVDAAVATCGGWPRGERIYSQDIEGAIAGGSSGSPVLTAAGEVVGQLSGICGVNVGDPCDAASNSTVDGALASYFAQVAPFLDPVAACTPVTEVCDDGVDNDCDGAIDCSDADCASSPACSATCAAPGQSCTRGSQCCSDTCKGPPGSRTCK
ncbi:MAG TPA: trypsin-like peptidase domain-containing protein [Candidatus Dormibacteraeota bacterium]|nr:trypsin-like peptidase domain-containing protein [Candidatus Dormibacteraeota bacterium]